MKKTLNAVVMAAILLLTACTNSPKEPKYIFYFIGDGMGFSHVSIAENYANYARTGAIGNDNLSFSEFPVLGMASTYSASNNITCSSAAGTALSTGHKTNNGFLGVAPDSSWVISIANKLQEKGYRIGVASSVNINHATPASFYGHSADRNDYYILAEQLATSNFDFFGGGGLLDPCGKNGDKKSGYALAEENGYTLVHGLGEWNSSLTDKVFLLQNKENRDNDLRSPGDRDENDLTLPQVVEKGIEVLETAEGTPFFFMVEGGKIDWFAHANNPKATILETLNFSDAIAVALKFYEKYPDETLIVVTADHETGGFAMGRKGYSVDFAGLDAAEQAHKDSDGKSYENNANAEKERLQKTNEAARLGWTTTGHCGGNVPVFAIGVGSEAFAGKMDNTDIPKRILNLSK